MDTNSVGPDAKRCVHALQVLYFFASRFALVNRRPLGDERCVDEKELRQKLRKIEALFAGAATPGERDAADAARDRIRARLRELEHTERPEEWRFALENPWSRRLFVALARRYGLEPYRRRGQRRTSIMVSAPPGFIRGTLIPEFDQCNSVLVAHLDTLAARIIEETLATDSSEPEERRELT